MEPDAVTSEEPIPGGGDHSPPPQDEEYDRWWDDQYMEVAITAFLMGAAYMWLLWIVTDWMRKRHG